LWDPVVSSLSRDYRCVVPELPLGSHRIAMPPAADLSPRGLARVIAAVMDELDLRDVTLIGNDTGGALSQLVAAHHPDRLARLVLTPCDAYENFLPPAFRPLQWIARAPGGVNLIVQPLRSGAVQQSPLAYGMLTKRPIDRSIRDGWVRPAIASAEIRRDIAKVLKGIDKRYTLEAAERLRSFDRPTLIAWAPEDRFFKFKYAQRLAAEMPNARLETIEDCGTFMPQDQPERLADLIGEFAREPAGAASEAPA
jgi:pimeloyl-ACP methyl ester carboxylesterase